MSKTIVKTETSFPIPRLEGETSKAYEAFKQYCLLGSDRSVYKAGMVAEGKITSAETVDRKNTPVNSRWVTWSSKYNWVQRSREYDNWLAVADIKIVREERDETIRLVNQQLRETFIQAGKTGLSLLQAIDTTLKEKLKRDKDGNIKALDTADARNLASAYQSACSGNKIAFEMAQNSLGLDAIAKIVEKDSTN